MSEAQDFNWKGEAGDKFAQANPSTAEGQDLEMSKYFQGKGSEMFKKVLEDLSSHGFADLKSANVVDVGCSSGGKLAILESLGLAPENLYGIDLSPKAVALALENHPQYHVKETTGFNYKVFEDINEFDLAYHSSVFCQIPEEKYDQFFQGIECQVLHVFGGHLS